MLPWIANWAARYAPTVEQQAEKALPELRLELFQAEPAKGAADGFVNVTDGAEADSSLVRLSYCSHGRRV